MQRKQKCHEYARPSRPRRSIQECEQYHRGQRMDEDVRKIMQSASEAEDLRVEHVRQPGNGKPVRGFP